MNKKDMDNIARKMEKMSLAYYDICNDMVYQDTNGTSVSKHSCIIGAKAGQHVLYLSIDPIQSKEQLINDLQDRIVKTNALPFIKDGSLCVKMFYVEFGQLPLETIKRNILDIAEYINSLDLPLSQFELPIPLKYFQP